MSEHPNVETGHQPIVETVPGGNPRRIVRCSCGYEIDPTHHDSEEAFASHVTASYRRDAWKESIRDRLDARQCVDFDRLDFVECAACHRSPGAPTLCIGCLANQHTIAALRDEVTALRLECYVARQVTSAADAFVRAHCELEQLAHEVGPEEACRRPVNERVIQLHVALEKAVLGDAPIPGRRSPVTDTPRFRYSYLVVIAREGISTVTPFHDLDTARAFASDAGAQWSETFLCAVLQGPLV